jgi:cardiolipin synthase A/B
MLFARVDLRNHRKITVIDGRVAYCGSQNLTDETFTNPRTKKLASWIDITARIEGPCVYELQTVFLQDWTHDSEEELGDLAQFFPAFADAGTSVAQVVPSGPQMGRKTIHSALLAMMYAAREEIVMTTPYFVPDEAMKAALIGAALRGVSVVLVLPDELDMPIVAAASRAHYEDLLEVGIRILHHEGGLLHAKTAVIDRELALVTSANLDMRSFWLNFEVSLVVYDVDFAGLLRFSQTKYIGQSHEVFLDEWRARPRLRRFVDNIAQLAGPLL